MDRKSSHIGLENSEPLIMLVIEPDTDSGSDQPHS